MSFINRILDSKYFKEALQKGEDIIQKDQLGLLNLIKRALQKVTETAANSNLTVVKLLNHYIVLFSQLIKAYIQGSYRKLPAIALAKIAAVLIYFISPFDFIPDVLPIIGFTDDLALVLWVGKSIKNELDEFELLHKLNTNKHRQEGKHKLKRDTLFKGKEEKKDMDVHHSDTSLDATADYNDIVNFFKHESDNYEEYVEKNNLTKDVHEVLNNKTNIDFTQNRRKPNRETFNNYYNILLNYIFLLHVYYHIYKILLNNIFLLPFCFVYRTSHIISYKIYIFLDTNYLVLMYFYTILPHYLYHSHLYNYLRNKKNIAYSYYHHYLIQIYFY